MKTLIVLFVTALILGAVFSALEAVGDWMFNGPLAGLFGFMAFIGISFFVVSLMRDR